ncbi:restriction endonuclease [Pantoea ananatis]|uniref:nSTAND3 domain-containing NTPase n=1 Tax=Pantoea ananas TaxID=553 RepID=UPI000491C4A2|nr:restriction endonuclease [Pantoea ananatis]
MNSYDFSRLNDKEFENLVIDIIKQDYKSIQNIERFMAGRDGGVDGRFYSGSNNVIIQCKHYLNTPYNSLLLSLKNEAIKVKKLNPSRYILALSQGLTPHRKKEIIEIFGEEYLRSDDILSLDDITHKIGEFKQIERKYYKLWLNSTSVLAEVLHNDVVGRSRDVLEKIKENIDRYVKTDDFEIAVNRLKKLNTLIITGAPGVGKTTLAEQICIDYALNEWEVVYVESDIEEAERVFALERRQLFLYDDFLGRNYFDALLNKEDSKIVRFINRIKNKEDKKFVLTSRTTILNQGKRTSELFYIHNTEQHEYEVEIKNASLIDKAKVLYNHIWLSELPENFKEQIWKDKNYRKIISHKNYNPRLISFITDINKIKRLKPEEYWAYIIDSLSNPSKIWEHMLTKQIPKCVYYLTNLVSLNNKKISETQLSYSYNKFLSILKLDHSRSEYISFDDCRKLAVKSTLQRTLDQNDVVYYDVLNPSISDCLISNLKFNQELLPNYFLSLNSNESLLNFNTLLKEIIPESVISDIVLQFIKGLNDKEINYNINFVSNFLDIFRVNKEIKKATALFFINDIIPTLDLRTHYDHRIMSIIYWIALNNPTLLHEDEIKEYLQAAFQAINDNMDYEDLNLLASLSSLLDEEELAEKIKNELIIYWEDTVHDFFKDSSDFNDYYGSDDVQIIESRAKDIIRDLLSGSSLHFSDKEVNDIIDNLDASEIIERNVENYQEWDGENFYRGKNAYNNYDNVDDLFDRS